MTSLRAYTDVSRTLFSFVLTQSIVDHFLSMFGDGPTCRARTLLLHVACVIPDVTF